MDVSLHLRKPTLRFIRIFNKTEKKKNHTMEKQYCRVGSVTSITNENHSISMLEYQYQNFMEKASNIKYIDTKLGEFFEQKAQKIKKTLEDLM